MSAGQMYRVSDFVPFPDFQRDLKYLPEIQFAKEINSSNLRLFVEIPFEKSNNEYIFLCEEKGKLRRESEDNYYNYFINNIWVYRGNGTLDPCLVYYDKRTKNRLWFSRAEVGEFIAQHPEYVALDVAPVTKDKRQWRADYPLLALVVDMIERGKSRKEIAKELLGREFTQEQVGILIKPNLGSARKQL